MGWILIKIVDAIADILILLLVARALLSWFVNGGNENVYRIYTMLCTITEPIVGPCRRFCSRWNTGALDMSVLMAFLLIYLVRGALIMLLGLIF